MGTDPRRVAMISLHTSPLDTPGSGDAGGLNVYVRQSADRLARLGVEVDVFTRARAATDPVVVGLAPGVRVHHVASGPFEGLVKDDLPAEICSFAAGLARAMAARPEGFYDVVHSHYWLSGRVAMIASRRWGLPFVHTMHTMARVKNRGLAGGDRAEPPARERGEAQIVAVADALVANTELEAGDLVRLYGARPERVRVVPPGVDLDAFEPPGADGGDERARTRAEVGLAADDLVVLFVGRIQLLKGPDVLLRAIAVARERAAATHPDVARRLRVVVLGGPSGEETATPGRLADLAADLGLTEVVRFVDPVPQPRLARWYRAADLVAVPSHNESFGLVAIEAQACGTPVVAADVGGLRTAVGGGVLVDGHDPGDWADALLALLADPGRRARLGRAARAHALEFGWSRTAGRLVDVYREAMENRAHPASGAGRGRSGSGPSPERPR